MSDGPVMIALATQEAIEVIPGDGIVINRKPLTVVIAAAGDPALIAPAAIDMVDGLARLGDWTFGPVAEALQEYVVANQPTGVAALLDITPDPIAFLFDQAQAAEPGEVHVGQGRGGWNTVFIAGPVVTLTVGGGQAAGAVPGLGTPGHRHGARVRSTHLDHRLVLPGRAPAGRSAGAGRAAPSPTPGGGLGGRARRRPGRGARRGASTRARRARTGLRPVDRRHQRPAVPQRHRARPGPRPR